LSGRANAPSDRGSPVAARSAPTPGGRRHRRSGIAARAFTALRPVRPADSALARVLVSTWAASAARPAARSLRTARRPSPHHRPAGERHARLGVLHPGHGRRVPQ